MTSEDRASLVAELCATRDELLAGIDGVGEEQALRHPDGEWSIRDVVEHLAITERGMLRMITQAPVSTDVADRSAEEAAMLRWITDPEHKTKAPENAQPTGRYATLELAATRFKEARERTISFVEACADDLRGRMLDHPRGHISGRECLILITYHPRRHTAQIRRLRGAAASAP